MSLKTLVAVTAGLLLWVGAQDETQRELEKLQGTWLLESVETKGKQVPKDEIMRNTLVIKGEEFIRQSGEKKLPPATFKIDPTKRPKTIDQMFKDKEGKQVVRPGIYELDGDTWRLAFATERPKELKTTPESDLVITTYRRQKK
jgi:uncharacterized protein (TIGR03067 family)